MITPKKISWWMESCDIGPAPESGAPIRMCTSAAALTHDVYCEQPYCSEDGNRLAMLRFFDPDWSAPRDLLVYDINRYRVTKLLTDVNGIANAAWSGVLFVTAGRGEDARLYRVDLNTLERSELFPTADLPGGGFASVSADSRWGLSSKQISDENFGIFKTDLQSGRSQLIHQSPDICNPHLQFRLYNASRVLVQENRGGRVDFKTGDTIIACDPKRGVGLYSIAADGSDRKDFPIGPPHSPRTTGHECWIGDTDRVLVTTAEAATIDGRTGSVFEVSHDKPKPRVVFEAKNCWNHISASRDGRFFVTDCYEIPGVPILVGSIKTGKTKVICHARTTGGGGQYSHAHPYLTSHNKHVVFNSDRTGLAQVYIATLPDGLLEELDA